MGLIAPVIASDRHVIVLRTEFVSFCLEFLHLRRKFQRKCSRGQAFGHVSREIEVR